MEYQEQQQGISGITVSSVLSSLPIENMTVTSNDDNDDNDEFYDASSDFNNVPLSFATTTTVIDTANIGSSQNDSRDKAISHESSLAAVNEYIEPFADSSANSVGLLSSSGSYHEARQVRQANTARVSPIIAQNVISQRSSLLNKSKSPFGSTKSHSPQPDLKDIKSIVERQEAELREELSRLKSNVQGDITNKMLSSNTRAAGTTALISSKSIEFGANGAKLSAVAASSPVFHTATRLPIPTRKCFGRSLIPAPRPSVLSRSTIRGLADSSKPSLPLSQHIYDETRSEYGDTSSNEQLWTDECF
ncbi:unnamed protein product [Onchocerca ochengi]|uniref:Uncharacterized protein n=1 Tax=Onchocerca ochengi TaxID=42157 RepID=A0A182ELM2_ONCOC|nr:unnamed protein product [Onchocerca ochengi]